MTAEQFAYWLQGYAELNAEPPTAEQWRAIRDHLALVFHKITPPVRGFPSLDQPPIQWPGQTVTPLRSEYIVVSTGPAETTC